MTVSYLNSNAVHFCAAVDTCQIMMAKVHPDGALILFNITKLEMWFIFILKMTLKTMTQHIMFVKWPIFY